MQKQSYIVYNYQLVCVALLAAMRITAKIGSLRNSNTPQEGRIYWKFFGNHHRLVQKGDKVTVAIGDFRATDLKVE
jgi:hypothetical protein